MNALARISTGSIAVAAFGGLLGCSTASSPPSSGDSSGAIDASTDAPGGEVADGGDEAGPGVLPDGSADAIGSPADGGERGESGVDGSYTPPPTTAVCSPSVTWAAGALLSVSTPSDDGLDSITPDELSIAWTEGGGSTAAIEVSDRALGTDPFGAPQALPAGQFTADRVSLSPDGLRLVVVDADGQGFSELTRASRTASSPFGSPATGSYVNLDGALPAGLSYGDPVLGADDTVFYYSLYGGSRTSTVFRTARLLPGDPWPAGAALATSTGLAAQGSLRRRPTGVSSDGDTLFVWDEITGTERAAWIDETTGAYDLFVDLGQRTMAAPDQACDRLYYSAQGATSVDLFVAAH